MHELGIVYHIIRDVENVARANGVSRVSSVTLLLGEVSGVVPDLLLDAWRWAADKKPITQGAELIVEPVEAVTHCEACGRDYATVEHGKTCPHCGSGETYLLQGQEVMIKQIETPDEDPAGAVPDDPSDAPRCRRCRQPSPHRLESPISCGEIVPKSSLLALKQELFHRNFFE